MVLRAVLRLTSLDNSFFGFFGGGKLLLVLTKPTPFATDVAAAEFFGKNEKFGRPQFFATFPFRTYGQTGPGAVNPEPTFVFQPISIPVT